MDSNNTISKAKTEAEQSYQTFSKAVKEKSPDAHILGSAFLSKQMTLFITVQNDNNKEILGLIKSFVVLQKENNQKTANALVKIVIVLLVLVSGLLFIILKEPVASYFANGIALYNKITPDQKFYLFYVVPLTTFFSWLFFRRKSRG